ncbi:MAG: tripartite tricarboxylate transporter substrate-binding protein [Oscillospiraceae bacterium]|nr:tripartite tricarboxylate transporter substrate-binding protein [Oscillospiraceae bacterium]
MGRIKFFSNIFKQKPRFILLAVTAVLIIVLIAVSLFLFFAKEKPESLPAPQPVLSGIIIPWNPGSSVDLVSREIINIIGFDANIENIHGSNGNTGLNKVYTDSTEMGRFLLASGMSAFVTGEYMGFTDAGYREWDIWLVAFSPSVIAVKADSPYQTLGELVAAAEKSPNSLKCANSGMGTVSFLSAYLFAENAEINIIHEDYAGFNPAVSALINQQVDFIAALSSELHTREKAGEVRILGDLNRYGLGIPFGEYYGFMLPKHVTGNLSVHVLDEYDNLFSHAVDSAEFITFTANSGLSRMNLTREQAADYTEKLAEIICYSLYETGCIGVSPETIGIKKP